MYGAISQGVKPVFLGAPRPLSASIYKFLCSGRSVKGSNSFFGRVKAYFGLSILLLEYGQSVKGLNRSLGASRPLSALIYDLAFV